MSLLFLSFIIQAALASGISATQAPTLAELEVKKNAAIAAEDFDEAKKIKAQIEAMPKVVAELEAKKTAAIAAEDFDEAKKIKGQIEAMQKVETPSSESQQASASTPASTENADPMAAVMAGVYANENAHTSQPGLNVRKAEDAKTSTVEAQAPAAPASTENADPMAAVMAGVYANENAHTSQPGLNIRKAEDAKTSTVVAQAPAAPASTENADPMAAVMAGVYANENAHTPQPGLNVLKAEDAKMSTVKAQAPAVTENADLDGLMAATYAKEDEPSKPKFSLNARKAENVEAVAASKTISDEAPKEVVGTFGQVTHEAPSPAKEVEAKKAKKNVVMHDMPHYRNHGGAMHHVEPTPRKSMTPEQETLAKEKAAKLAENKFQNVFHVPKAGESSKPNNELSTGAAPDGILRKLTRFIFFLVGLCSLAGMVYHKFDVIVGICQGKQGPQKFEAKRDDDYGFAPAPRYSPQVTTGSPMSSVVGTMRQGLARRGPTDTTSSCEYGV